MMPRRFTLCAVFILFLALVWAPGHAQVEDFSVASAINDAGRQRMLTQRIVLAYCQLGLGVLPDESRQRLVDAIALFDKQLAALRKSAPTREVHDALAQVAESWGLFRSVAEQPPTRDGAGRLLYWVDDLLFFSNKVVRILQDLSNEPYARLVNIAGRQRMLSQRAAELYMLQEWGFDTLTIRDEMLRAVNEFTGALVVLRDAPENTDIILAELDEVQLQWSWFYHALSLKGDDSYRLIVADSSEAILRKMDILTRRYEQLTP